MNKCRNPCWLLVVTWSVMTWWSLLPCSWSRSGRWCSPSRWRARWSAWGGSGGRCTSPCRPFNTTHSWGKTERDWKCFFYGFLAVCLHDFQAMLVVPRNGRHISQNREVETRFILLLLQKCWGICVLSSSGILTEMWPGSESTPTLQLSNLGLWLRHPLQPPFTWPLVQSELRIKRNYWQSPLLGLFSCDRSHWFLKMIHRLCIHIPITHYPYPHDGLCICKKIVPTERSDPLPGFIKTSNIFFISIMHITQHAQ